MPDLSRLNEILMVLPAIVGLSTVIWAWRITAHGRERERSVEDRRKSRFQVSGVKSQNL